MSTITGRMATSRPARYAKQLTSHWSARGPVTDEDGTLVQHWEDGKVLRLEPREDHLRITVSVPAGEDADRFAQVVADHLVRFGSKEELSVAWDPQD